MMKTALGSALMALALIIGQVGSAFAADLDVEAVRARLEAATPAQPADFSGADLSGLDLSGLDLSGANLAGANLSKARLADARLVGANLSGANLDGAWLIGADFSQADLSHVHMFGPVVADGLETSRAQSPVFKGARFSDARVIARLSSGNNANADFSGARLSADMRNQSMGLMRFEAQGADLRGADFSGAELGHALFKFADLRHADFRNADIRAAEFGGANLEGAMFAGAKAKGATFDSATLEGATGIDRAEGMDTTGAR